MKCLIIDQLHESIEPLLQGIGLNYDYMPSITPEEVKQLLPDYEGIILRSKMKLDQATLETAPKLRFIARAGAGVDEISGEYLQRNNVSLINAPEGNRDAVGEQALGMLLSLFNKLNSGNATVRAGQWLREEHRGIEVKGKTVGIIGYGNMGRSFAQRLSGFECKVIAYDKYKINYGDIFGEEATLDELFEKADILSLHTPLTSETKGMVDAAFLRSFKKDIYLINTARGPIIPLADLAEVMKEGKVRAAALDVLENEKLETLTSAQETAFNWLIEQPNTLFMPHVGGWTVESYQRINEVLVKKIDQLLNP